MTVRLSGLGAESWTGGVKEVAGHTVLNKLLESEALSLQIDLELSKLLTKIEAINT